VVFEYVALVTVDRNSCLCLIVQAYIALLGFHFSAYNKVNGLVFRRLVRHYILTNLWICALTEQNKTTEIFFKGFSSLESTVKGKMMECEQCILKLIKSGHCLHVSQRSKVGMVSICQWSCILIWFCAITMFHTVLNISRVKMQCLHFCVSLISREDWFVWNWGGGVTCCPVPSFLMASHTYRGTFCTNAVIFHKFEEQY
jgi:hypothetical protein